MSNFTLRTGGYRAINRSLTLVIKEEAVDEVAARLGCSQSAAVDALVDAYVTAATDLMDVSMDEAGMRVTHWATDDPDDDDDTRIRLTGQLLVGPARRRR